jgi:hypothetical protein
MLDAGSMGMGYFFPPTFEGPTASLKGELMMGIEGFAIVTVLSFCQQRESWRDPIWSRPSPA